MNTTSITLLERLRHPEDQAAWQRFVSLYLPMLTRWARAAGVFEQNVADLVQDVLIVVVKKLPEFEYDRDKSFRSWLKSIILNKWRDRLRKPKLALVQPRTGELEEQPDFDRFGEAEYRRQLLSQALELVVNEFQEKTWRAFQMHGLDGLSAVETARRLGMTEGAVYTAKSRVLSRLRAEIGEMLS